MRHLTRPVLLLLASLASSAATAQVLTQAFDDVTTLAGAGWVFTNNSNPAGTTGWFQGNTAVFTSQTGADRSYIAANFNGAGFGGNVSDWLITPVLSSLRNGQILTFYTRAESFAPAADNLEVRLSTNGTSSNVGASDTSVGDFTTLLLAVNPTLAAAGYPATWTLHSVTLSGLPAGLTQGRLAFRHVVPTTSANADYIGVDTVSLVTVADLSITNSPSSGSITAGANVTYTLGVVNNGPAQADNVTVTFALPAPLTFVSCSATNGGVCGGSGNNRTVTYAALASAATSTITMVAALPCSAVEGSSVSATATIASSGSSDPTPANSSATAVFWVTDGETTPVVTAPSAVGAGAPNHTASVANTAGSTYAWLITNGTITAGQGTSQITFTAGTEGIPLTLSVTVTSALGCTSAPGTAMVTVGPVGSYTDFYTVTPCRQLDTRSTVALAPGATLFVPLAGASCGIPATATAVSINVAVTQPTAMGFLTIYPADRTRPLVSNINFGAGQTRANNAIVPLAIDGSAAVKVFNGSGGTSHVIIDVNGYFQ